MNTERSLHLLFVRFQDTEQLYNWRRFLLLLYTCRNQFLTPALTSDVRPSRRRVRMGPKRQVSFIDYDAENPVIEYTYIYNVHSLQNRITSTVDDTKQTLTFYIQIYIKN